MTARALGYTDSKTHRHGLCVAAISILILIHTIPALCAQFELEPVAIQLRWYHQFQFADYYAAVEKGFYADEGLEVSLREFEPGMMLRFERAISPGDVLETDGAMVRVKKISLRATVVRTKDEKDLLIPNSQLVQRRVANFTFRDSVCRVWTMVGVSYSSDLRQVRDILEKVCAQMDGKSDQHAPEVLLTDFGTSSVNFKISVWIENPWVAGLYKSDLNEAIWWSFEDAGIEIAFPQLDVHLDRVKPIGTEKGGFVSQADAGQ